MQDIFALDQKGKGPDGKIVIQNFYTIGLWNYCGGAGGNVTRSSLAVGQRTAQSVDFCTGRRLQFAFDFKGVWGLSGAASDKVLGGKTFAPVLAKYQASWSKWLSTLYILATLTVGATVLVGIGGLFSRLGSLFTTLSALVSTAFLSAFAALATACYFSLGAAGNEDMANLGIQFRAGATMYAYLWLVSFSSS